MSGQSAHEGDTDRLYPPEDAPTSTITVIKIVDGEVGGILLKGILNRYKMNVRKGKYNLGEPYKYVKNVF
jgi:hypothetical protein